MSEEKKYELLKDQTIEVDGKTLYRIRALRDFGMIRKGDLGGFIEKESNLSHQGDCWISVTAKVFGEAFVSDNAKITQDCVIDGTSGRIDIKNNALIEGHTFIEGNVIIEGSVVIRGSVVINGDGCSIKDHAYINCCVRIYDKATISGNAYLSNNVVVKDCAFVSDRARIYDNVIIGGHARVDGHAYLHENAKVLDHAFVSGYVEVTENSIVAGKALLSHAICKLKRNSVVLKASHYLTISPIGSRNATVTFTRSITNDILVTTGCFSGNLASFKECVVETHGDSKYAKDYLAACQMAENMLGQLTDDDLAYINKIKKCNN